MLGICFAHSQTQQQTYDRESTISYMRKPTVACIDPNLILFSECVSEYNIRKDFLKHRILVVKLPVINAISVVDGNHRLKGALVRGYKSIPCTVLTSDNYNRVFSWNDTKLPAIVKKLKRGIVSWEEFLMSQITAVKETYEDVLV